MIRILIAVVMLVAAIPALAGGRGTETWARSESSARASSSASAFSGGNKQSVYNGGATQAVSFQAVPEEITVRQAPDVSAPPVYPTAPCRIAVSAGVSFLTGGVSGGGSVVDEECQRMEWTRILMDGNERQMGLNVACNSPVVRTANPDVCKGR